MLGFDGFDLVMHLYLCFNLPVVLVIVLLFVFPRLFGLMFSWFLVSCGVFCRCC